MNLLFRTPIAGDVRKHYLWMPVVFLVFALVFFGILAFPTLTDREVFRLLMVLMTGFNITLTLSCLRALARVESRLSGDNTRS